MRVATKVSLVVAATIIAGAATIHLSRGPRAPATPSLADATARSATRPLPSPVRQTARRDAPRRAAAAASIALAEPSDLKTESSGRLPPIGSLGTLKATPAPEARTPIALGGLPVVAAPVRHASPPRPPTGANPGVAAASSALLADATTAPAPRRVLGRPSAAAASKANVDPAIVDWLRSWEDGTGGSDATDPASLKSLLLLNRMSASDTLDIAEAVGYLAADPGRGGVTAKATAMLPWCNSVLDRADEESHALEAGTPQARALFDTLQACVLTFSALRDGPGFIRGNTIARRLLKTDDPELPTVVIRYVGGLYIMGDYDKGLSEISENVARESALSEWQRLHTHWIQALLYCASDRYAEAIPHLKIAAESKGFSGANDAAGMLILAMIRAGRVDETDLPFQRMAADQPDSPYLVPISRERRAARAKRAATAPAN